MTDKTKLAAARDAELIRERFMELDHDAHEALDRLVKAIGDETDAEEWECFCDSAYFDMWVVSDKNGDKAFTSAIHVNTKEEAEFLVSRLNAHPPAVDWIEGLKRHDGTTNGEDDYVFGWNAALDAVKEGMK